jgi:hypothetical protein
VAVTRAPAACAGLRSPGAAWSSGQHGSRSPVVPVDPVTHQLDPAVTAGAWRRTGLDQVGRLDLVAKLRM